MAQHHNMSYILLQASALHTHLVCALMLCPIFVYASPIHLQAKRNTGTDARMGWMPPSTDAHSQALGYSSTDTHHGRHHVHMMARPYDQVWTHGTHASRYTA